MVMPNLYETYINLYAPLMKQVILKHIPPMYLCIMHPYMYLLLDPNSIYFQNIHTCMFFEKIKNISSAYLMWKYNCGWENFLKTDFIGELQRETI
jgi:hypothetical protein